MKLKLILVMLSCLAITAVKAQHCRYDGGYMIAVYLVDKDGKPVSSPQGLFLKEKQNPLADSCSYAEGQLMIPFDKASRVFAMKYGKDGDQDALERSRNADFLKKGYYVVMLNMSQKTCMIKQGSAFRYQPRVFAIEMNGVVQDVTPDSIYPLCTDGGSWDRIRAITVMVN